MARYTPGPLGGQPGVLERFDLAVPMTGFIGEQQEEGASRK